VSSPRFFFHIEMIMRRTLLLSSLYALALAFLALPYGLAA
jgi:hypothetical protein